MASKNHGADSQLLSIKILEIEGSLNSRNQNITDIKTRCTLAISIRQEEQGILLYTDSQICSLGIVRDCTNSPMAHLSAISLFYVRKYSIDRDDGIIFGLAEEYNVSIEFEPIGDGWLLMDIFSDEDVSRRSLPPQH
ncbi:hypothetical protein B0T24DRAFT_704579 [Lasiosphaeria ovina]|uniref:Uncharacterized protein n=1 Tax=Lasiosphaeria ovina TaxID=92902 RepID=A0AAE0N8M4_9PEZI|nr:hypothetical protein B0T24DRAFT_704579 [Lasiosphaeria ovina]